MKLHKITIFLIIFSVTLLAHFPSIRGEFIFDDYSLIVNNPSIQKINFNNLKFIFTSEYFAKPFPVSYYEVKKYPSGYFRPVATMGYALLYSLFDFDYRFWHLTNILMHSLIAFLIFLIGTSMGFSFRVMFSGSLLFACHPSFHQVVDYCTGLVDLLAVFFALSSMHFLIKWNTGDKIVTSNGLLAVMLYSLSIFSKEITVLTPFMIFALPSGFDIKPRNTAKLLLMFFPLLVLCLWRYFVVHLAISGNTSLFQTARYYAGVVNLFFINMETFFFPFNPRYMQQFMALPESLVLPLVKLSLVVIFTLLMLIMYKRARPLILWFILACLPVSNIVPLHPSLSAFALYYSQHLIYFSSVPLCILTASVLYPAGKGADSPLLTGLKIICLITVIVLFTIQSINNSQTWASPEKFYTEIITSNAVNSDAYINLGVYYNIIGQPEKAASQFETLLAYLTKEQINDYALMSKCLTNLGFTYLILKRSGDSLKAYEKSIELYPSNFLAFYGISKIYSMNGRKDEALKACKKALEIYPDYQPAKEDLRELTSK